MPPLEWIWKERNRSWILLLSGALILVIALVDWATKPYVSLGFLYLFPIMLVAAFFFALGCGLAWFGLRGS